MARALALAALLGAGCYLPTISDGQYSCASGSCPEGFDCTTSCKLCVHHGEPTDDSAQCSGDMSSAAADLAPSGTGCTALGGVRPTGDPGLPNLAFCYAVWQVPGVDPKDNPSITMPGCERNPDGNSGTCNVSDNCGLGWHVCQSPTEATADGLDCLNAPPGFWVTLQTASKPSPPPLAPLSTCKAGAVPINFAGVGCDKASYGLMTAPDCLPFNGALDAPACGQSSGAWSCKSTDIGTRPANTLVKVVEQNGGVICCRD
jgi:hypothetical protein